MKVTEEGTTNIIKWYQPESIEECNMTDCKKCIFHRYVDEGVLCQFRLYLTHPPVRKPTDTDKSSNALQDQRSAQDILNMCASLQANTMQMQVEPLQNMVNVLDLIIEITEKQDELVKSRHEQPVQEDQSCVPTWFIPSMENANDDEYGRDYYHHCPKKNNKLVRLSYLSHHEEHICPVCKQSFEMR